MSDKIKPHQRRTALGSAATNRLHVCVRQYRTHKTRPEFFAFGSQQPFTTQTGLLVGTPIDAFVSVGFKWLCGPYGTGFVWVMPEFRQQLRPIKAYWLTKLCESRLSSHMIEDRALTGKQYESVNGV
jgi:hypothetical protein